MSTLKNKIEELQAKTTSPAVYAACNEALSRINQNNAYVATNESELETLILNNLLESIETNEIADDAAASFVSQKKFEERVSQISNLGVMEGITSLETEEIANHPAFSYVFERLKASVAGKPEWKIVENAIEVLSPFNWDPAVNNVLAKLSENAGKHKEEIHIYGIIESLKGSTSSYLYTGIADSVEKYLQTRSTADRISLMEKAGKFLFDPHMKNLYNFLGEAERNFHIAANDNSCSINRVYSPISMNESSEYFMISGKLYKKSEDKIEVANEQEIAALPLSFTSVVEALTLPNVAIEDNRIKIYTGDKKVEIVEENANPAIYINGNVVSIDNVHRAFLNSGIFRVNEGNVINTIKAIAENWGSIFEIDFAKTITSKADPSRLATVFFVGESIYVNKENRLLGESVFYSDCNAIQTKNLVMEHMKFDISSAFTQLLNEEEKQLAELKAVKADYQNAIATLAEKKAVLENASEEISQHPEVVSLIEAIEEEINFLKEEYSKLSTAEFKATQISEGLGFKPGDEAELSKKK